MFYSGSSDSVWKSIGSIEASEKTADAVGEPCFTWLETSSQDSLDNGLGLVRSSSLDPPMYPCAAVITFPDNIEESFPFDSSRPISPAVDSVFLEGNSPNPSNNNSRTGSAALNNNSRTGSADISLIESAVNSARGSSNNSRAVSASVSRVGSVTSSQSSSRTSVSNSRGASTNTSRRGSANTSRAGSASNSRSTSRNGSITVPIDWGEPFVPISPTKLTEKQEEVVVLVSSMGLNLTDSQIHDLVLELDNSDAVVKHYFENMDKYEVEVIPKNALESLPEVDPTTYIESAAYGRERDRLLEPTFSHEGYAHEGRFMHSADAFDREADYIDKEHRLERTASCNTMASRKVNSDTIENPQEQWRQLVLNVSFNENRNIEHLIEDCMTMNALYEDEERKSLRNEGFKPSKEYEERDIDEKYFFNSAAAKNAIINSGGRCKRGENKLWKIGRRAQKTY